MSERERAKGKEEALKMGCDHGSGTMKGSCMGRM